MNREIKFRGQDIDGKWWDGSIVQSNEVAGLWSSVNQTQAAARTRRKESNLAILRASSLPLIYRNCNYVVQVRDARFPGVDFLTSTSRWKYNGRHILGDATEFLAWLERKRKA